MNLNKELLEIAEKEQRKQEGLERILKGCANDLRAVIILAQRASNELAQSIESAKKLFDLLELQTEKFDPNYKPVEKVNLRGVEHVEKVTSLVKDQGPKVDTTVFPTAAVQTKAYYFQGHTFGPVRTFGDGVKTKKYSFRICQRCGRSDENLFHTAKNGVFDPCK